MTKNKQNTVLKVLLSCIVIVAMSGCKEWDKAPDKNATVEVAQNSNAILEPIQVVGRGYDYLEIHSSGVDEDGIDHVDFYAILQGSVKSRKSKKVNGDVSFNEQVRLTGLKDNTVYELRTVCYSVNGKTKSIEKQSVKTFAKTPNDPSNDNPTPVEPTPDTQAPIMTLNGQATITLTVGDTYTEQGVTVTDNVDTGLTATIWGDTVDTSTAGTYIVTYNVTDAAGNVATEVSRTVNVVAVVVVDTQALVMTLNGLATITLTVGEAYTEQGVSITDNVDTGLTATIWGDTVDTSMAGTYTVTYNVTDAVGNVATEVTRTVNVVAAPNTAPVINQTSFDWGWLTNTKTFPNVVSDDWSLWNITMTASPTEWTLVYNGDWSITYTRTDWHAGWSDVFDVTFSDGTNSTTVTMTFTGFDDE